MQKNFFQKRHFSSQSLDFLPPKKPGLYISRKDFFFEKKYLHGEWNPGQLHGSTVVHLLCYRCEKYMTDGETFIN